MSRINVKDCGAKGKGETDDTEAIEDASRRGRDNGADVFFPPGRYINSSNKVYPGWYHGASRHLCTIVRCAPKPGDTIEDLKWRQTFKYEYDSNRPPGVLKITDLTFDGSSEVQGPYKNRQLQQAHLIAAYGPQEDWQDNDKPEVDIRRCDFLDGTGDAISLKWVSATVADCTVKNVYRGGVTTNGNTRYITVRNFTGSGDRWSSGFNFEATRDARILLENINLPDGGFDVMAHNCLLTARNVRCNGLCPMNLTGTHAVFTGCEFDSPEIRFPQNVEFIDSIITGKTRVWWYLQKHPKAKHARLAFRQSQVGGLWLSKEEPKNENWLVLDDCLTNETIELARGGNVHVQGGQLLGAPSLKLAGYKSARLDRHFNVILDGVDMRHEPLLVHNAPENNLEYRNMGERS